MDGEEKNVKGVRERKKTRREKEKCEEEIWEECYVWGREKDMKRKLKKEK